jgi:hypothetical protein
MQKISYMGNGETTEFTFNFPYFENSDVIVTKNGTATTGYNIIGVSGGLDADIPYIGGTVVFETAPGPLDSITISRSLPLIRNIDYQPLDKISPTTLNQDMNYTMEILKDLNDELATLRTQYHDIADQESAQILLAKINAVQQQITALGDITRIRSDIATLQGYDYVIETQSPTAENDYTWYRKYKSGWVEQGGKALSKNVTLPVTMANTNYSCMINTLYNSTTTTLYNELGYLSSQSVTGFTKSGNATTFRWFVCGEYAQ